MLSENTVNVVAGVDPNMTPPAPVNPYPMMVTLLPPAAGPYLGEIPVIVGWYCDVTDAVTDWVGTLVVEVLP